MVVANHEEAILNHEDQHADYSKQNQESTLAKSRNKPDMSTVFYQGYYFPSFILPNIKAFQQRFQPHDTDILIVTKPKSGTTWLNSLVYSIVHRTHFNNSNHPLLTKSPHQLVLSFECNIYSLEKRREDEVPLFLSSMTSPRLFASHLPYSIISEPIKAGKSKCKIVFMARNPFDTVVSYWTFMTQNFPWLKEEMSLEDLVESFCKGEEVYGPTWDHVLGYWKESLENPNNVLFLKYEDMHNNGVSEVKKLAEFLGFRFSEEEEREGVIQEILRLCSIDNLKNLEVNKAGNLTNSQFMKDSFFRKGKVGDWVNHLSPSMTERLGQVMSEKFSGSGLEFKI